MDSIEIKKVKKGRASDQIVEQLSELINKGVLKPGQKLPGEYHLAKQFGVSRTTIREALRTLETIGMAEIINGVGAYVTDLSSQLNDPNSSLQWLIERKDTVVEIQEVREGLEGIAARLCAERITPEQLETLRDAAIELEKAEENLEDADALLEANINFHYLIGEYSGNPLLGELILHFENLYSTASRAIMKQEGRTLIYKSEHNSIFEAIAARDGQLAEARMREHISNTRADIASLGTDEE